MRGLKVLALAVVLTLGLAWPAAAHFGMVIPQSDMVSRPGPLSVELRFWHPMENKGMDLLRPVKVGVDLNGKKTSLLKSLQEVKLQGKKVWRFTYQIRRPGDYIFYMEPQPYWEPAEDKFIIHYTKTVVDALEAEEGWDRPVGLPVEIIPLTRPYGLWAGNCFTGQVVMRGKPVPGAEVEVEFFNPKGERKAPAGPFVTQVVKADANGVFTYTMPWGGWWGFAALLSDPKVKLKKDGKDKEVELGGVIWVYAAPVK
jgi:cobalt/nickel transport protein